MAFLLQLGAAGRVERDAGLCGVGEVRAVGDAVLTPDRGLACLAGGAGSVLEGQEGVDCLLCPDDVQVRSVLGDRGQFPEDVLVMPISA